MADSLEELDIAIVGVPYDGGVSKRLGARHGPQEIRTIPVLRRKIHQITKINPYDICSVADVGDVRFKLVYDHETMLRDNVEKIR